MEYLTTAELAAKYPVEGADSEACWFRLLDRWRTSKKLKEGVHWKYRRDQGAQRPPRVYLEAQVLKLVYLSDRSFCISVRIEHEPEIRRVLRAAADAEKGADAEKTLEMSL